MNRNTKILLIGIITGAVIMQLLNMIFSGQPLRIGGELFIPMLVILIRHTVRKIIDVFRYERRKIK